MKVVELKDSREDMGTEGAGHWKTKTKIWYVFLAVRNAPDGTPLTHVREI